MARRTHMAAGVAVACVAASIAMLTACGTAAKSTGDGTTPPMPVTTPPSLPSASPSTVTSPPEGTGDAETKCTAADLEGSVAPSDAGAGNRYADLVVTNTSEDTCTLYGYGGLELTGADGTPLPTELTRAEPPKPSLVTLPPGGKAAKELHWTAVPGDGEPVDGPCETPAAGARVIPPDDTRAFTVTFAFGPVCGHGHVDGSAYFKK